MNDKAGKLLVVESDDALREHIVMVLSDAGYEVSTDYREGLKAVLAFNPDAVVMGADPPQLDCCDLLSEIKGSERTRNIRVVMLSPGKSAERTRGLDLGADDVLSLPFDPHELLSRLRSQLRNKFVEDESLERLRKAEENRNATQQVVTAVNEERRTLRVGGVVIVAVLIVAGLAAFFFYRRTQQQNTRVYAALTRLQTGVLTQQQLMERSRRALEDGQRGPSLATDPEKLQLKKKSEDLRAQIASSQAEDASALQNQLTVVEGRLQKLESEGKVAQTIIQSYEPSVCLIHVVLGFRDHTSGLRLHYAGLTSSGEPTTDEHNNPLLSLNGDGPEVRLDVFGTGFLASAGGQILTNHHVAEPWWQNDDLKELLSQGLEPAIVEMTAYFPGVPHGIAINTERISSTADVAVVRGNVSGLRIKQITLAEGRGSAVSGGPVVLLGYPTALDAILARAGAETLQSIATASKGDPKQVMEELARRNLIRPTTTQGHIGDVLPDKIVYDAQTTSGGSGGPLFSNEGKVIGINFAMVREFGGSNFAIPVGYGKSLLNP
ncbi:trypsin-like peptidase domain-containing protein [Edaphobacter bradus]|uniref:trypsin-like peptidase domain-containing protein n=1 Tax=Edaphobacter bradus TaxID=2259016 RepID=UPI0021DFBFEF|nr:trypsin-like peptidase domain-containing protein [Edaphobacter bradus]